MQLVQRASVRIKTLNYVPLISIAINKEVNKEEATIYLAASSQCFDFSGGNTLIWLKQLESSFENCQVWFLFVSCQRAKENWRQIGIVVNIFMFLFYRVLSNELSRGQVVSNERDTFLMEEVKLS